MDLTTATVPLTVLNHLNKEDQISYQPNTTIPPEHAIFRDEVVSIRGKDIKFKDAICKIQGTKLIDDEELVVICTDDNLHHMAEIARVQPKSRNVPLIQNTTFGGQDDQAS